MKKLVFILLFLYFSIDFAIAFPRISDDFYLNNRELWNENTTDVVKVLPNTLRLELCEGESSELYADFVPKEATETRLKWSVVHGSGVVNIFPKGERCVVIGIREGKEDIEIKAEGGATVNVSVEVTKPKQPRTQSFEYIENIEKKEEKSESAGVQKTAEILSVVAVMLLIAAGLLILKCRGESEG